MSDVDAENERRNVSVAHDTTARFVVSAIDWPSTGFCNSQLDRAGVDGSDEVDLKQRSAETVLPCYQAITYSDVRQA